MARITGTSRIVAVSGRSGSRSFTGGSLRRERSPDLPTTWWARALTVVAALTTAAIATRIADALQTPGLGGFPPIP